MNTRLLGAFGACALTLSMVSTANAALTDIGGGMIYDDDLDITWLANANAGAGSLFDDGIPANIGRMSWANATAWAASLSVGGYNNWRLPTTTQPDPSCGTQSGGEGLGVNCTGSEMGHLFYDELSGTAGNFILTNGDPDLALFSNVQSAPYWSSTGYTGSSANAWDFFFSNGNQSVNDKSSTLFAWAVADGNVSVVPIPAAVWLFGSGLIGLVGIARRKKAE